jgi:hypothetical protein
MSRTPTETPPGGRRRPIDLAQLLWLVFAMFAAGAVWDDSTETMFDLDTPYGWGKPVIWFVFIGFLAYSAEASRHDSLPDMLKAMLRRPWGRQIGLDLYIGLFLFGGLIWLVSGDWLALAVWLVALCVYGNLASLLWLVINYDLLVARLAG